MSSEERTVQSHKRKGAGHAGKVTIFGFGCPCRTIAVAAGEPDGEVRSLGTIPNRAESIRKLIKKLGPVEKLRACYEAGPTGYVVYWQLAELGVKREVIVANFGTSQDWRPGEDGSARCREAGA